MRQADNLLRMIKEDYTRARRMCGIVMPENCNYFMFAQFHLSQMRFFTGVDDEKREQHKMMAEYYNERMSENNRRYETNWY